ncbi:hypothetical protein Q3G72_032895 [Acer saccharum]|nr:hypothetical protein Q3G72_032895 [Acer saccharum]
MGNLTKAYRNWYGTRLSTTCSFFSLFRPSLSLSIFARRSFSGEYLGHRRHFSSPSLHAEFALAYAFRDLWL